MVFLFGAGLLCKLILCGSNITVVELQLVGRAGVTERMKHNIGDLCVPLQTSECFGNYGFLTGASVWQRRRKKEQTKERLTAAYKLSYLHSSSAYQ